MFHESKSDSKSDDDHQMKEHVADFTGLHLLPDFLTVAEEESLAELIESDPNWKESQSGRRKIDYGPSANFKKKKLKVGNFAGLPHYAKDFIFDKLERIRN